MQRVANRQFVVCSQKCFFVLCEMKSSKTDECIDTASYLREIIYCSFVNIRKYVTPFAKILPAANCLVEATRACLNILTIPRELVEVDAFLNQTELEPEGKMVIAKPVNCLVVCS